MFQYLLHSDFDELYPSWKKPSQTLEVLQHKDWMCSVVSFTLHSARLLLRRRQEQLDSAASNNLKPNTKRFCCLGKSHTSLSNLFLRMMMLRQKVLITVRKTGDIGTSYVTSRVSWDAVASKIYCLMIDMFWWAASDASLFLNLKHSRKGKEGNWFLQNYVEYIWTKFFP